MPARSAAAATERPTRPGPMIASDGIRGCSAIRTVLVGDSRSSSLIGDTRRPCVALVKSASRADGPRRWVAATPEYRNGPHSRFGYPRTFRIYTRFPGSAAATIGHVPIYEFECGSCGARFEELVGAGTQTSTCHACGADEARRVYSPPAPEQRLVKSGGTARKQEARNAQLRARTRRQFKAAGQRARGGGST
ncbi:MAG: zinc ribbon domain-containing protein [Actinobacteria bacterium]|nr:MAG: zinc ribbon domain-containing protein [Actinomycetota bacterium]